jgi:hypothetical protein
LYRPNGSLGHFDILFDPARTGSNRTNHDALPPNRKSAPKYSNLIVVDAVQRLFWPSQFCEISR